jgi:Ni/Co efflux regulator RcnB
MKRFLIALSAVMLLAAPAAFAQSDLKANGDQPQTEMKTPNETHKKKMSHKKMAHKKSSSSSSGSTTQQ